MKVGKIEMGFIKKNIKLIVGIMVGTLLVSGISVYSTYIYFANEIKYTNDMSVADALNDLYKNKKETSDTELEITENGKQTLEKYYKNLNVNVPSPSINFNLINDSNNTANGTAIFIFPIDQYKYFKILNLTKDDNVGNCKFTGWSVSKKSDIDLNLNQEYKIRSETDGYKFDSIALFSNSKSAVWSRCYINIILYN